MNTKKQKNILMQFLSDIGDEFIEIFEDTNAMIAGGAIRSVFCNTEINDVDVYFRNSNDAAQALAHLKDFSTLVSFTEKSATLYKSQGGKSGNLIQLIFFKYFDGPEDIFKTFDFDCCMGAYDFQKKDFILHDNFLLSNLERTIKINVNTAFPIISLLRVEKYKQYGYKIPQREIVKLSLAINKLKLNSWEAVESQTSGMYGYKNCFSKVKDQEFSIDKTIEILDNHKVDYNGNITIADDEPKSIHISDFEIHCKMHRGPLKYYKERNSNFGIAKVLGKMASFPLDQLKDNFIEVYSITDIIGNKVKKILKRNSNGTLGGKYRPDFIYTPNTMVIDPTNYGLHFYNMECPIQNIGIGKDEVIGEFFIEDKDFLRADSSNVLLFKKAYFCNIIGDTNQKNNLDKDDLF